MAVVLTDEELVYILETQIPELLERRPDLQRRIYAAFLDTFVRRDEVAAILAELRELRSEFEDFRLETRERFEQVDQRFEEMNQRFEEMNQRFEQVDQRFEQVDQRFEEMGEHFEQVDQDLGSLNQQFQDLRDWVELVVGRLQVRSGRNLENVVAGALRLALKRPDIRPESIRLRQKIVDVKGEIFPRGRQKEVDLVASDGEYLVFEVKSAAEPEDVEYFADKVALVELLNPEKTVRGVFITLAAESDVRERCQELGIELAS